MRHSKTKKKVEGDVTILEARTGDSPIHEVMMMMMYIDFFLLPSHFTTKNIKLYLRTQAANMVLGQEN
jgi:hypothetical protein